MNKPVNPNNCPACTKRKPYKRTMRLCGVCWKLVPPRLQGQIVAGYNPRFETGSAVPAEDWLILVGEAVKAARGEVLIESPDSPNNLLVSDSAGEYVYERDFVRVVETGVAALVLRLLAGNKLSVRLLSSLPETMPVRGEDVIRIENKETGNAKNFSTGTEGQP